MQQAIVAIIVVCAFWFAAARYAPKALKRAVRGSLARLAQRYGWQGLAARLQAEAANGSAGCSDGCGSCGACETTPAAPADSARRVIPIKTEKPAASR